MRIQRSDRRGTPADLLVVGLGNPGAKYAHTRHNVGVDVIGRLLERLSTSLRSSKELADVAECTIDGARVVLAVPRTYMNESGQAVGALCRRHGIDDPARLVIVHDELDLEPGVVRVKQGGGLAGHNGLRSITAHIDTKDYLRVRLGVGKPPNKERGADHVLRRPSRHDQELLDHAIEIGADAVELIVSNGVADAMNQINARPRP